MIEGQNKKDKFHKEYEAHKDHYADHKLVDIFETYVPYWLCKDKVLVEKEVELDRFSKIILQTIDSGLVKHQDICDFLGVDQDSFVTIQFHYLIKNELIEEVYDQNELSYKITYDGISFLKKKKKIKTIDTTEFQYYYNDMAEKLMAASKFEQRRKQPKVVLEDESSQIEKSTDKLQGNTVYQVVQSNRLEKEAGQMKHKTNLTT